jgi:hypothetical protein
LTACASGHCRGRKQLSEKHLFIARAEGSKQCTAGSGETIDQMAEDLIDIKIFSKETRSDGKVHMALCGAPTGRIHVFEISETDRAAALSRGFTEYKKPDVKKTDAGADDAKKK